MLIPMAKVEIVGWHRHVEAVLDALHRMRRVQFVDLQDEDLPLRAWSVQDAQVRRADEWRLLEARLEALLKLLPGAAHDPPAFPADDIAALRAELDALAPRIEALTGDLDALRVEQDALPRHVAALRKLMPLVPAFVELERYETVALLLDARHPGVLDLLRRELEDIVGTRFAVASARVEPDTVGAILAFPRAESARVHALLGRERVSQVHLPAEYAQLPLAQAVVAMEARQADLPGRIATKEADLHALVAAHAHRWEGARRLAAGRVAQLSELEKLGTTGHAFVLHGWAPARDVGHIERALSDEVGRALFVRTVPIRDDEIDRVPVALDHAGLARPFGYLLELFSLPRAGAFDPTGLMTLFLPLFFGLMVGDLGYAAVIALVAMGLRRRTGVARHLGTVLLLGSAWSALFGVLFGEFFGTVGRAFGLRPLWLDREEAIVPLLVATVGMGAAHVVLGLVLGLWGAARRRQGGPVAERAGLLAAVLGAVVLGAVAGGAVAPGWYGPGLGAIGLGAVAVLVAHGALGLVLAPLEVLRVLGNVLSYLRLAALGLASVYLARAANDLGALGPLWLGVLVAGLLHAVNIVLAIVSPTIQALRLHYVEFFSQFYEDGGRPFVPFGTQGSGAAPRVSREEATWNRG